MQGIICNRRAFERLCKFFAQPARPFPVAIGDSDPRSPGPAQADKGRPTGSAGTEEKNASAPGGKIQVLPQSGQKSGTVGVVTDETSPVIDDGIDRPDQAGRLVEIVKIGTDGFFMRHRHIDPEQIEMADGLNRTGEPVGRHVKSHVGRIDSSLAQRFVLHEGGE
jgi:hypothetical protein